MPSRPSRSSSGSALPGAVLVLLVVALVSGAIAAAPQAPAPRGTLRPVPDALRDTAWIREAAAAQQQALAGAGPAHDFRFTDRIKESGITFIHNIVDDAGKTYKAAHYDHGNGLAAADVDGDGRVDLYFTSQTGGNQLWRNLGEGRFENITTTAGVGVPGRISVSASFADVDNDGDPDLYVTTVRRGNLLFRNDGQGRFTDISTAAGLDYSGHSSGALFFDYDKDGRIDLFLVNVGRYTTDTLAGVEGDRFYSAYEDAFSGHLKPERTERSRLYRNQGGNRFVDVSEATGLLDGSWSGDATVVDGNDDGWPDLYVLNMEGDDQYYENQGGTRFVGKSRQLFPKTSWGSMGVKVFDVNNDGRLDIFITDMHSDMSDMIGPEREKVKSDMKWPVEFRGTGETSIWGNTLFLKEGPDRYREASDAMGTENYCPWGPSVGDLNADGFDDVLITSGMNYPERYMLNAVKLNDRGQRFVDAEFVLGVEPRTGGLLTPWFDLDASGADRAHPDAAGATGLLRILGARASRSAVIADLDGDGDLDIVTNEFNAAPMVLISDLAQRGAVHFAGIRLEGTASNRDGLGAVVTLTAGGATYTKVMDGSSGYLSHSLLPLYFGLGSATAVERVEVQWPSGRRQVVESPVPANTVTLIREPDAPGPR